MGIRNYSDITADTSGWAVDASPAYPCRRSLTPSSSSSIGEDEGAISI